MFPIQGFSPTDATFNLGFAIGTLLLTKPKIYLAMNGCLFPVNSSVKILMLEDLKISTSS